MTSEPPEQDLQQWHRHLYVIAALMTYLLVSSGALVCVTNSSHGCPDWPACQGRAIPPAQMKPIIEWSHRLGSALTLPFLLVAAFVGLRRYRSRRWLSWTPLVGIALLITVAAFGRAVILYGLSRAGGAADLGCALLALATMVAAAVASSRYDDPRVGDRFRVKGGFAALALTTAVAVFLVLLSAVLVARKGEVVRCVVWPVYNGSTQTGDLLGNLQLARLGLAAVTTVLVGVLAVQAWRTRRSDRRMVLHATAAAAALAVATGLGVFITPDGSFWVPILSLAPTVAVWAFVVAVVMRVGLTRQDP